MEARTLANEIKRTIELASAVWPDLLMSLGVDDQLTRLLRDRWNTLPLTAGFACPFAS